MPAPQIIGYPWGRLKTWETDDGPMSFQGYDAGYCFTTNEAADGWYGTHITDDPQGEADVIAINRKRFRAVPD